MAKCLPIVHTATMHQCRNCFVRQPHAQRATAKKKGNGRLVNQPNFRQTKALVFVYFPTEIEANYILFWTSSQLLPLSFLFIYLFIFLNNKKKLEGGLAHRPIVRCAPLSPAGTQNRPRHAPLTLADNVVTALFTCAVCVWFLPAAPFAFWRPFSLLVPTAVHRWRWRRGF